ncbi:DNA-3-methyladenine glycosylase family protein [Thermaurantiacus sp.]
MGLDAARLEEGVRALARMEPAFADVLACHGMPPPRLQPRGLGTLLRTIVAQHVSTAAATAIWHRLEALGNLDDPAVIARASPEALRAAGLSRQKIIYVESLAAHVSDGRLALDRLPADDEEAIARISAVRGLGRWSAEIYLLFAEGRADAFPAGDLALRIAAGRLFHAGERPSERQLRARSEPWRPHRGAAALLLWHAYSAPPV